MGAAAMALCHSAPQCQKARAAADLQRRHGRDAAAASVAHSERIRAVAWGRVASVARIATTALLRTRSAQYIQVVQEIARGPF